MNIRRLRRIRLLLAGLAGVAFVLVLALAYWQILPGEIPPVWDDEEVTDFRTRGSILDCDGHYLALDRVVYDLDAYPNEITVTKTITGAVALVEGLEAILETEYEDLLERFVRQRETSINLAIQEAVLTQKFHNDLREIKSEYRNQQKDRHQEIEAEEQAGADKILKQFYK